MPPSKTFVRPAKKNKKREATYETYDEAMDGGVEMEEQGERFRLGEKAQRFYEKALELYRLASSFSRTFDSEYNTARVLYILSTSFHLLPRSGKVLQESIVTFRSAIDILHGSSTGSSRDFSVQGNDQALLLDARYNLAQALLDQATLLEDTSPNDSPSVARAKEAREEALRLLHLVADGQTAWVEAHAAGQVGETETEMQDADEGRPRVAEEEDIDGMDVDLEGGEEQDAAYEVHEPTSYAIVETLLLIIDSYPSLWDTMDSAPEARSPQDDLPMLEDAVQRIRGQGASVPTAGTEADVAAITISLDLARRSDEITALSADSSTATEKASVEVDALLARSSALYLSPGFTALDPVLRSKVAGVHLQVLSWKSKLELSGYPDISSNAWSTLSAATKIATSALEIPVPILEVPLYRPSILLELSTLSLRRAQLPHPSAIKNRPQLLLNAETYTDQALDALGWAHFVMGPGTSGQLRMTPAKVPPEGGWDRESLARKCLYRSAQTELRAGTIAGGGTASSEKLAGWARKVSELGKSGVGSRRLREEDLRRIVEEDQDDGLVATPEEGMFWREFLQRSGS